MSDYLSDEEQVERIKRWWSENGTSTIVGLVVAIASVIGWRLYQDYSADLAEAAFDDYAEFVEQRKLDGPVDSLVRNIEDQHAGSAYHVFTLWYRAKDAAEEQDWEAALGYLQSAVDQAGDSNLEDMARMRQAKVEFQLDRLDDCLSTLALVRGSGFKSAVSELIGDVHRVRGELDAAKLAYEAGLEAARDTPAAGLLELKLASLAEG